MDDKKQSDIDFFIDILKQGKSEDIPGEEYEMAVYNIIRTLRICGDDLIIRDMNGIDFCNISLNGIRWSKDADASYLQEVTVNINNFVSGHCERINIASLSKDGKYALTCSEDGMANLWNAKLGTSITTYKHDYIITDAFIASDNIFFVTVSSDHTAVIHSISSPGERRCINNIPSGQMFTSYLSADDKYLLICAGNCGQLYRTDTADGKPVAEYHHDAEVSAGAISADSSMCITCDKNGNNIIHFIGSDSPDIVRNIHDDSDCVHKAAFLKRNAIMLFYKEKTVIINAINNEQQRLPVKCKKSAVITCDDNILLYVPEEDNRSAWLKKGGFNPFHKKLTESEEDIENVTISGNGRICVLGTHDGSAIILDHEKGVRSVIKQQEAAISQSAVSYDGEYCLITSKDCTAVVYNTKTGETIKLGRNRHNVRNIAISADSQYCAAASYFNMVMVWNTKSGQVVCRSKEMSIPIKGFGISRDGSFCVCTHDKSIDILSQNGDILLNKSCDLSNMKFLTMFNQTPRFLLTFYGKTTSQIWEYRDNELSYRTIELCEGIQGVSISHDDKLICVTSEAWVPEVYEAESGRLTELERPGEGYEDYISNLTRSAISAPDQNGSRLCAAAGSHLDKNGNIGSAGIIWELPEGRIAGYFTTNPLPEALRFSADGKELRYADSEKIYTITLGSNGVELKEEMPSAKGIIFSSDASTTVSSDFTKINLNGKEKSMVLHFVPDCFAQNVSVFGIDDDNEVKDILCQNGAIPGIMF